MRFGYFLSGEEHTPAQLMEQARLAQEAGFDALWVSDHFHPWNDAQGQSPFVWSIIGGISQVCDLPVTSTAPRCCRLSANASLPDPVHPPDRSPPEPRGGRSGPSGQGRAVRSGRPSIRPAVRNAPIARPTGSGRQG